MCGEYSGVGGSDCGGGPISVADETLKVFVGVVVSVVRESSASDLIRLMTFWIVFTGSSSERWSSEFSRWSFNLPEIC